MLYRARLNIPAGELVVFTMGNEDKRLMASLAHLTWEDVRFSTSSPCSDDDIMVNDLEWVKWSAIKEVIDLSLHDCYSSVKSNHPACCLVVSIIPASHMLRAWVGPKGHFSPITEFPTSHLPCGTLFMSTSNQPASQALTPPTSQSAKSLGFPTSTLPATHLVTSYPAKATGLPHQTSKYHT